MKGIGRVGFEPTQHLQEFYRLPRLRRLPLIKAYVQPQLLYYLPKGIFISGFRFVTWTLPMFPVPTNGACQSRTPFLLNIVISQRAYITWTLYTNWFYSLKHFVQHPFLHSSHFGNRGFWRLGFSPPFRIQLTKSSVRERDNGTDFHPFLGTWHVFHVKEIDFAFPTYPKSLYFFSSPVARTLISTLGFEPRTSSLWGKHSNQLSYIDKMELTVPCF